MTAIAVCTGGVCSTGSCDRGWITMTGGTGSICCIGPDCISISTGISCTVRIMAINTTGQCSLVPGSRISTAVIGKTGKADIGITSVYMGSTVMTGRTGISFGSVVYKMVIWGSASCYRWRVIMTGSTCSIGSICPDCIHIATGICSSVRVMTVNTTGLRSLVP